MSSTLSATPIPPLPVFLTFLLLSLFPQNQQPVHQVLPRDRNHSTMPLGAEGYQKVDQQEIPIPFANIQLLIPREAVVAQLKTPYGPNQEVLWTEAREKSLPEQ